MPAHLTIELRCRLRWWIYPYLAGVATFCELFGTSPNYPKVFAWIHRALVLEVRVGNRWRRVHPPLALYKP